MIDTRRRFLGAIPLSLLLTLGSAGFERAVAEEAPRIVAQELKQLVAKGEAVIVDVRSQSAWDVSHIDGAVHIPLAELPTRLKELPKDKLIACYCT
jgi:predicted sulfurtransferase